MSNLKRNTTSIIDQMSQDTTTLNGNADKEGPKTASRFINCETETRHRKPAAITASARFGAIHDTEVKRNMGAAARFGAINDITEVTRNIGTANRFGAINDTAEVTRNIGTADRFGAISDTSCEPRRNMGAVASRFAGIPTDIPHAGPRMVSPSTRFNTISDMQDPRHIIGSPAPKISIRNTLVDTIDHAIRTGNKPVSTPKTKPQTKQKAQKADQNLDDDEDDETRAKRLASIRAQLDTLVESEDDNEEVDDESETHMTKAERKAAKQEAKRKRMIAEGKGYMYGQH